MAAFPLLMPATKLPPKLIVFDLDKTLIAGNSTVLWTEWLYEKGIVKDPIYRQINREMERDYAAGTLDIAAYERKQSGAFRRLDEATLTKLVSEFVKKRIAPLVYPEAKQWVKNAVSSGTPTYVLSASTSFLVAPVARMLFGIENAIGIELERVDGFFTGEIAGIPSYEEGKVERLQEVLAMHGFAFADVLFFTDSRTDLPLARAAGFTCCVNPDPVLLAEARRSGWRVLKWELPLRTQIALGQKA
ncbi:HAD family phosphatase [Sutterella sp.]|uniref:HAD family hydrolase n=1 Tax=Sutterella sp. TaxID=1981025 RepID=UPI0026DF6BF9|nr:HAD family hydrolase [Sutterella sp.]MDO5531994.1 HAD family hydrolase [Sutterella sp.]